MYLSFIIYYPGDSDKNIINIIRGSGLSHLVIYLYSKTYCYNIHDIMIVQYIICIYYLLYYTRCADNFNIHIFFFFLALFNIELDLQHYKLN